MPEQSAASKLFEPFRLGANLLANRIVMAPMSRNRADDNDVATALTVLYYRQRATAGLIVTEASPISVSGRAGFRAPGIYTAAQIAGWRRVSDAVHAVGGKIFLQLWHAGRISHPSLQPAGALPLAPSALAATGTLATGEETVSFVTPRALATAEIPGLIARFAEGADNARRAGFDGVEVHAANGYLIDQFLRDGSNRRVDAYGGSLENRARFLLAVVDAVARAWTADRITVRLSPPSPYNSMSDSDPQRTFGFVSEALSARGLAALHVDETPSVQFDWDAFRRRYRGSYIANAGYDRERAEAAIANGHADLVSFGVAFLANADLVERLRTGAALNAPDRATFYGGDERGYTDYPTLTGHNGHAEPS
ncbi:MAG: alkene reductase [Alphaproteobacteria bacterium]